MFLSTNKPIIDICNMHNKYMFTCYAIMENLSFNCIVKQSIGEEVKKGTKLNVIEVLKYLCGVAGAQ